MRKKNDAAVPQGRDKIRLTSHVAADGLQTPLSEFRRAGVHGIAVQRDPGTETETETEIERETEIETGKETETDAWVEKENEKMIDTAKPTPGEAPEEEYGTLLLALIEMRLRTGGTHREVQSQKCHLQINTPAEEAPLPSNLGDPHRHAETAMRTTERPRIPEL